MMRSRRRPSFTTVMLVLGLLFLYLPMVVLVVYSFNESRLVTVWAGFSTQWYGELFRRYGHFRGKTALSSMVTAPLVMPEVITGLSLLLLFVQMAQLIGWPADRGMATIWIAHTTFDGFRLSAGQNLLLRHATGHCTRPRCRLAAGLYAVVG